MFSIGSYVMYGKRGVCKVEDIGKFFEESMHDSREYYKLSPIFIKGDQVYIPVENHVFMREIINSETARKYLDDVAGIEADTFFCRQQTRNFLKAGSNSGLQRIRGRVYRSASVRGTGTGPDHQYL